MVPVEGGREGQARGYGFLISGLDRAVVAARDVRDGQLLPEGRIGGLCAVDEGRAELVERGLGLFRGASVVEGVTREVPGQDRAAVVLGLQVLDEPRADHVPVVRQIGMVRDRAREEHRRRECRGIERGDGAAAERVADRVDARALRAMPMHIADNAGYDSADLISSLRAKHYEGHSTWGLEMDKGGLADMNELGIREAFKVKQQVVLSASEAAEMILRVDDIVQCAPRQRQQ